MSAEDQLAIEEICLLALDTDPCERQAFLRRVCPDDHVRLEVESLLAASDYADALFKIPPELLSVVGGGLWESGTLPGEEPSSPGIGQQIGPYRLTERLGEGGMGVVYRASQHEPVRREVALKIIRPGMDSAMVAARFEAERQALALMDHSNIARVVDAGTTAGDRAYFVMELVRGEAINRYCANRGLTVRQRVQLIIPVCHAIQHAHQRGVIHRDIKPSNILVDGESGSPVPKVIDFGIAKAIGDPLYEGVTFTRAFDVIGTLEYMSPEQAEPGGCAVDVRSDVYALGAVLYELLAGSPPIAGLSMRESGFATLLKRIQEEIPQPPSQRIRGATSLNRSQLQRECDWIVLKALEKDPERRYESAAAMARDLQRFLDGEPVEAGQPSRMYRLGKLARRYRAWVATAAVFILVLVAATLISAGQAFRATRAEQLAIQQRDRARLAEQAASAGRDRALAAEANIRRAQGLTLIEKARADNETAIARAVASFLQDDLLTQASPNAQAAPAKPPDPNLTVRAVLDRSAAALDRKFPAQPVIRASLEQTIANAYLDVGLFPQACEHGLKALQLRRQHLGAHHPQTLASMERLAVAYRSATQFAAAEKIWTELYPYQRMVFGESHPATLQSMHNLAALYRSEGKYANAVSMYERVIKLRRRVLGSEDPETMRTANNLAYAYMFVNKNKEAATLHEANLALRRRVLGPEHPDTLTSMSNLALAYQNLGRDEEARNVLEQTLATQRRTLGPAHPSTLSTILNLGRALASLQQNDQAEKVFKEGVKLYHDSGQDRNQVALTMMNNLGLLYIDTDRFDLAEDILSRVLATQREVLGKEHPDTLRALLNLGNAYRKHGKYQQAEPMILEVLEARRRLLGEENGNTLHAMNRLTELYLDTARFAEAADLSRRIWESRRRLLGEDNSLTVDSLLLRAKAAVGLHDDAAARNFGGQALELRRKKNGETAAATLEVTEVLARNSLQAGRTEEAVSSFDECLKARERALGLSNPATIQTMRYLASALSKLGQPERAEALLRRARSLAEERQSASPAVVNLLSH